MGGLCAPRVPLHQQRCIVPVPLQCKKYRDQLTPQRKALLQAKLCASELFKDKKTLYSKRCHLAGGARGWGGGARGWHWLMAPVPSLQQPFQGEYLGLTQNPKYQKLHAVAKDKLVMAESVLKVNRANGKVSPVPVPVMLGGWGGRRATLTPDPHRRCRACCC